jgi:hypothetical protein
MKNETKTFFGLLIVGAGLATAVYLLTRRGKNPYSPSDQYDVDNLYSLPEGVTEVSTAQVPDSMTDAVRWVHRYFILSKAYVDGDGNTYLVEEHEGFDPLVFQVVSKEA